MLTQVAPISQQIFSKINRIPDLLSNEYSILSLYTDGDQVLHMQCRLRDSGYLVLFPVTFRLVNRYLSGDYTLTEVAQRAPCRQILLVTKAHNILDLDKQNFDFAQLSYSEVHYTAIESYKVASVDEIRRSLHACMRG